MPPRHTLPHTIAVAREESNVEVLWFLWGQFKIMLCRALISSLCYVRLRRVYNFYPTACRKYNDMYSVMLFWP